MRNMDLTPLYRASVGFDRIADLMDRALTSEVAAPTYPPYNIEKTGENAYRISIAVAGFAADDLSVEMKDGAVIVAARKGARAPLALLAPFVLHAAGAHDADGEDLTPEAQAVLRHGGAISLQCPLSG